MTEANLASSLEFRITRKLLENMDSATVGRTAFEAFRDTINSVNHAIQLDIVEWRSEDSVHLLQLANQWTLQSEPFAEELKDYQQNMAKWIAVVNKIGSAENLIPSMVSVQMRSLEAYLKMLGYEVGEEVSAWREEGRALEKHTSRNA